MPALVSGPNRVGPAGLAFFALRARAGAAAEYMPGLRAPMTEQGADVVVNQFPRENTP
jgi:hypothetical protein